MRFGRQMRALILCVGLGALIVGILSSCDTITIMTGEHCGACVLPVDRQIEGVSPENPSGRNAGNEAAVTRSQTAELGGLNETTRAIRYDVGVSCT
jgi:hypothetical protein